MTRTVRYRINVATSVKGIKTWDATVEVQDDEETANLQEETLYRSNELVAELDKRYPPPPAESKKES